MEVRFFERLFVTTTSLDVCFDGAFETWYVVPLKPTVVVAEARERRAKAPGDP